MQPNEAGRIILIVGLGWIRLHRGNLWVVEAQSRLPACRVDSPFV